MFENAAFNKRRKKRNCLLCLPGLSKYLIKQGCFIGELIILSSPVSVGFFFKLALHADLLHWAVKCQLCAHHGV